MPTSSIGGYNTQVLNGASVQHGSGSPFSLKSKLNRDIHILLAQHVQVRAET